MTGVRPADLVRAIAREGSLERALSKFPDLDRSAALALLESAASTLEDVPAPRSPRGSRSSGRKAGSAADALAMDRDAGAALDSSPGRAAAPHRGDAPGGPSPESVAARAEKAVVGSLFGEEPFARPRGVAGGKVRIYCDGAARGNPGPASAGAVIADATGRIIERHGRYLGHTTNNVAEYEGLLLGLEHAHALGAREVEILADSQLLIRQLGGQYKIKAPHLLPLADRARRALAQFDRFTLRHIPREQNAEADAEANRALDDAM